MAKNWDIPRTVVETLNLKSDCILIFHDDVLWINHSTTWDLMAGNRGRSYIGCCRLGCFETPEEANSVLAALEMLRDHG